MNARLSFLGNLMFRYKSAVHLQFSNAKDRRYRPRRRNRLCQLLAIASVIPFSQFANASYSVHCLLLGEIVEGGASVETDSEMGQYVAKISFRPERSYQLMLSQYGCKNMHNVIISIDIHSSADADYLPGDSIAVQYFANDWAIVSGERTVRRSYWVRKRQD